MDRSFVNRTCGVSLALCLVLYAVPMFGQRGGAHGGGASHGMASGHGHSSVPPHVGIGSYGGYGRGSGYGYGSLGFRRYPALIGVPYYLGGYYGDYGYGYSDSGPAPSDAPPVIVNQYYSAPPQQAPPDQPESDGIHIYPSPSQQQLQQMDMDASEPRTYLLAFKDHSVYSVLSYWVEGNTMHYLTPQNVHNQADVSLIDMDFTSKLNQDADVPSPVSQ